MPRCPWKCRVQGALAGGAYFWDGEIPQGSHTAAYIVLLSGKTKAEVSLVIYLKLLETRPGTTTTSTSTDQHTLRYILVDGQSPHRALCTQMHRATMQATRPWQRLQHPNAYSAVWQVTCWIHRRLLSIESCVWLRLCFCSVGSIVPYCTYPFCFTTSVCFRESHKSNVCQSPGSLLVIWWCTNWCKEQVKKDACAPKTRLETTRCNVVCIMHTHISSTFNEKSQITRKMWQLYKIVKRLLHFAEQPLRCKAQSDHADRENLACKIRSIAALPCSESCNYRHGDGS